VDGTIHTSIPFELKNFVLPPLRSSCTEKFFSPNNLGIVPPTDYFTHPLTMLHKPAFNSFSSASSPQRVFVGLAHMDFARAKPRQQCRTPYADQFVQCLSMLLRRTTAQTAQLLAVTPLASNNQGY